MDRAQTDWIVERLRRGTSVALATDRADGPARELIAPLERELRELGRTTIWIDLDGAESGAELGSRIVEGCMTHLDPEDLSALLEQLPSRGRIDLEAFVELLMLPERVAEERGRRVVCILEGFHQVERVIGFPGLGAVRDALVLRDKVSYLFVGSRRLEGLFTRPETPLYGLAELAETPRGERRESRAGRQRAPAPEPAAPASDDPLASVLLQWAEPPPAPQPVEERSAAELAWERLLAREAMEREWFERLERDDDPPDDRWWRRGGRRRRR
jgi:hypothetical protein